MNPLFPIPNILLLFLALAGGAAWLAWHSSTVCGRWSRASIAGLRFCAVCSLAVPLINPGEWRLQPVDGELCRAILVDVSASMDWKDAAGRTRRDEAAGVKGALAAAAERSGEKVEVFFFADGLSGAANANGPTDIVKAVAEVVGRFPPGGPSLRGVVVVSDGRQIAGTPLERAVIRCRAAQVPVDVVPVGQPVLLPDVEVDTARKHVTAFRGQSLKLPVTVSTLHLPSSEVRVLARLNDNAVLETKAVRVAPGRIEEIEFNLPELAPGYHEIVLEAEALPGERETANNRTRVGVQVLAEAVRVLLVEGSPYWDTKFIAQLLQQERNYRFEVVYRLSDERFFSLEGSEGQKSETPQVVERAAFPASGEEMAAFDLIVFGRNVDPFLDAGRVRLLREWVETRGGALVLARGNPLTTPMPALEEIFPSDWNETWASPFRWRPTSAGEDAGLFGSVLPGASDPIWKELPPLQEARYGQRLAPFSQVLAEGRSLQAGGVEGRFPALVSRRVGEGLVISVNTEDLWRWDFFPQVAEAARIYRDFWFQLFQWAISYSEFLPGKQFALRLSHARVDAGQAVRARILKRPGAPLPSEPRLKLMREGKVMRTLQPAQRGESGGAWEAIFSESEAGLYSVALEVEGAGPEAEIFATLRVLPLPSEEGSPDPAPEFLEHLAKLTGGATWQADDVAGIFRQREEEALARDGKPEWQSSWADWPWIPVFLGCFFIEWVIRRRNGLT